MIARWFILALLLTTLLSVVCYAQDGYELKPCPFATVPKGSAGVTLVLSIPPTLRIRRGKDVDYLDFSVASRSGGKNGFIYGIWGPNATGGKPSAKLVTSSQSTEERIWTFGDYQGVDARGVSKDGTKWRYLGMYGESLSYEGVSAKEATLFDSLLDNVCFLDRRKT